jgi:DNA adenine methylase
MISYIGGKARIGKWIAPLIPKNIETYVECFGGMFWVFFNMDIEKYPNLKTVVYNDFNKLNANLFRCSKQYDRLLRELKEYPRQEYHNPITPPFYADLFNLCQKEVFDPTLVIPDEADFEIAAKYLYVLTQVFSGSKPETSKYTDYKGKYRCKIDIFEDKLRHSKYREHLDKITFIESQDFQPIIYKYDSPSTYFYLDPPYWKTENYYSSHDFDSEDHHRLSSTLKTIKGKFGLSYYEFPQLHKWYPQTPPNRYPEIQYKWESKGFAKAAAAKEGVKQNIGTELLIMNY